MYYSCIYAEIIFIVIWSLRDWLRTLGGSRKPFSLPSSAISCASRRIVQRSICTSSASSTDTRMLKGSSPLYPAPHRNTRARSFPEHKPQWLQIVKPTVNYNDKLLFLHHAPVPSGMMLIAGSGQAILCRMDSRTPSTHPTVPSPPHTRIRKWGTFLNACSLYKTHTHTCEQGTYSIHPYILTIIQKERRSNPGSGPPLVSSNTWWGFRSFRKLYKISLPFSPPLLGLTKTSKGQLPLSSLLCCWERKEHLFHLLLNCTVVSLWATRGQMHLKLGPALWT